MMTREDENGDVLSKNVLDWLTRVGGIATALATIFALFFPNLGDDAKRFAYVAALLIASGSAAIYYYRHRRTQQGKEIVHVPSPSQTTTTEALPLQPRVLMIVYNPIINLKTGQTLLERLGWNEPNELAQQFVQDIQECSHGLVKYQILERNQFVARVEVHDFPLQLDGTRYASQEYLKMYQSGQFHGSEMIDYGVVIKEFNVLERIANNEFDEVWLFGFPGAGFYASTMAGKGAFFCNAPPVSGTVRCPKRFMILGFNYERGVGDMLEAMGHRAESILAYIFGSEAFLSLAYNRERNPKTMSSSPHNLFERFLYFDQIAPGQANVGTVDFAPNSEGAYDFGNRRYVRSYCDDWLHYPYMPGVPRQINAKEWGDGDLREHHRWWLSHLPHADGITDGIANNWWQYIIDPNNVP